jgi:hypothetical protein
LTASPSFPNVVGKYDGTIHNNYLETTTTLSLLITQDNGNINGTLTLGPGLRGSGPLNGTIDSSGKIQFIVHSNEYSEPFSYSGKVAQDGSLSGMYCNTNQQHQCDPTGEGTWSVRSG